MVNENNNMYCSLKNKQIIESIFKRCAYGQIQGRSSCLTCNQMIEDPSQEISKEHAIEQPLLVKQEIVVFYTENQKLPNYTVLGKIVAEHKKNQFTPFAQAINSQEPTRKATGGKVSAIEAVTDVQIEDLFDPIKKH